MSDKFHFVSGKKAMSFNFCYIRPSPLPALTLLSIRQVFRQVLQGGEPEGRQAGAQAAHLPHGGRGAHRARLYLAGEWGVTAYRASGLVNADGPVH